MGIYRWLGYRSDFGAENGRTTVTYSLTGGSIKSNDDADFESKWLDIYYSRPPRDRGEDIASIKVTRPDGTSFRMGRNLTRLSPPGVV